MVTLSFQDLPSGISMVHRHFGIDIAKKTFQVCFLYRGAEFQQAFSNNEKGFKELLAWAREQSPKGQLRFSMEFTGGYERDLTQFLKDKKHYVSVLDPGKVFHFKKSLVKVGKSDPSDAYAICVMAREREPEEWNPRPDPYVVYLQLNRSRDALVEQLTATRNRAGAPGVLAIVREQFDPIIAVLEYAIENLEARMAELEAAQPEFGESLGLLVEVTGIATVSARQILAEMGPIQDYPTPHKLALAAGLVPIPRKSGTSLNNRSLVPYGNAKLRCAAYRIALVAKRYDPAFKAYANRIESNGNKSKKTIITACARKLMHIIWAILKYKTPYNPEIFMKHAKLT
jgi:transposase